MTQKPPVRLSLGSGWLLGPIGTGRAGELAALLKSKRSPGMRYSPWHSLAALTPQAAPLLAEYEALAPRPAALVTDEAFLRRLASLLQEGKPSGFPLIKRDENFPCRVLDDVAVTVPGAAEAIAEALDRLVAAAPWIAPGVASAIDCFVPIDYQVDGRLRKRALSSTHTYGAVFITVRGRAAAAARAELAVDMAHELGHHLLMAYQLCDPLITSSPEAPVFSGVRRTERPAVLALHAACALAFMISAASALREAAGSTPAEIELLSPWIGDLQSALALTLRSLRQRCHFSEVGAEILDEFEQCIRA